MDNRRPGSRLARLAARLRPAGLSGRLATGMIARADAARDAGRHDAAAALYQEVLRLLPRHAAMHVQRAHMLRTLGDLDGAEAHYRTAARLQPDDAETPFQLGLLHRMAGRPDDARRALAAALAMRPGWDEPARALDLLDEDARLGIAAVDAEGVVAALLPRAAAPVPAPPSGITIRRLGTAEGPPGSIPTLRGVEAIRGFCISDAAVTGVEVVLDDETVHVAPLAGVPLPGDPRRRKHVFNLWIDLSRHAPGARRIALRVLAGERPVHVHRQAVTVAPPLPEARAAGSDAAVPPTDPLAGTVEAQVNARPSMVRPAPASPLPHPPRSVLVQRVDQLGDLAVSVPALRRLRALLPDARLVGLVTAANAELAATLGLFDAVEIADFAEDASGRRTMTAAAQATLRGTLAAYRFDIALDLSVNAPSRPLLLLSGAPFLYGFGRGQFPFLSADVDGAVPDPGNGQEAVAHARKLVGLVEWLGALLADHAAVVRRPELSAGRLAAFGIDPGERFAVLHAGGRLAFSRWPHHPALAALILAWTELKVVLLADEPLPDPPPPDPRLRVIDRRLPFDDLDALLSFCAVFVGNDTGPKHLAALRGVPVVSVHMARLNWNEWGQSRGLVVSRRVPCAGCGIHARPEECGKGFACLVGITAEEVFAAMARLV